MSVVAQVESAFVQTPYPGDLNITGPCRCDECREIADYFRGTSWRGHTAESLRYHADALSLFTPAAFRFWLPAFMLAELHDPNDADVIAEFIAYTFRDSSDHSADRVIQFTSSELDAILAFLRECAARYNDGVYDVEFNKAVERIEQHRRGE